MSWLCFCGDLLGSPSAEGAFPGDGQQGWTQGKGGAAGRPVHGKCGERAGTWTPTSIFLSLIQLPNCCFSPVLLGFTAQLPPSCSPLCVPQFQALLPAHGMEKSARQELEDIGLGTKQLRGFTTLINHVWPRQKLDEK